MEAASVQCVVTSPPYWGLRDYGVEGQLGLEATPAEYLERMTAVFAEVWRVLRDDGVLWCNMGDSYCSGTAADRKPGNGDCASWTNRSQPQRIPSVGGLKPKDLCGMPWRLAFALQDAGWYLRSDVIWSKPNPMPESCTDRPTKSHEYIFMLTKRPKYYFDADAVREPEQVEGVSAKSIAYQQRKRAEKSGWKNDGKINDSVETWRGDGSSYKGGRNIRTVWTIPTQHTSEAHFATFPEKLVSRCIACSSRPGDTILDPFIGSGTAGRVAERMGRKWVGIELNPEYINMAEMRTAQRGLRL